MGALTSNRKRGDECFTLNHTFLSPYPQDLGRRIDSHISKKPRLSSMPQTPDPAVSSRSTASRIQRYPEPTAKLRREVHAPCRVVKFGFAASSNRESRVRIGEVDERVGLSDVMGNVLSSQYEKAKNTAIKALRYFRKDKEVIDVENERGEDLASEDSSIEEIEAVEDGREGRSVVSDERSRGGADGTAVPHIQELEAKNFDRRLWQSSSSGVTELSNVNLKMLDSLTLRETDVELGVLPHKKWLDSAEKRNSKLRDLSVQIKFLEAQRSSLHALRPAKKPEEEVPREPFLPLTQEEEAEVDRALSSINRRKVLVTHENSNIEITGEILQCLQTTAWLNDELISGRNSYDYKSVRRWTTQRKLGYSLSECDKIFVPIHQEIHWCLAVINKQDKKFQYLDSLKGMDTRVLKVLARYYVDEVKDKSGKDIDLSSWEQEYVEDLPEQENGYDCGMFMIKYADFYSRGIGLCFNQEHMPYFRLRTAKEILKLKAD
ncbi:hypothetical protein PVL29_005719 [Vitis rotundifolia]|uniref:Ubiquitin-like protease family profile domain-containing protein n=1 Tax=Vitis rotundifolia TaxID=103349 RepID=A0AA39A4X9_VITRO|nr:hypothetical protein PVL29_005719 [Vitis rotundifolia]